MVAPGAWVDFACRVLWEACNRFVAHCNAFASIAIVSNLVPCNETKAPAFFCHKSAHGPEIKNPGRVCTKTLGPTRRASPGQARLFFPYF